MNELARVSGALSRLNRMELSDVDLIRPMLENYQRELTADDSVMFLRQQDQYLVGGVLFKASRGMESLHYILQRGRCEVWEICPIVMEGGDDRMTDLETVNALLDRGRDIQEMLEDGDNPDLKVELRAIESYLSESMFGGSLKRFPGELDRARKSAQANIAYSIEKLMAFRQTRPIGAHLLESVKTGFVCRYNGDWKWKLR